MTKAVPEGFHTLTPHLILQSADQGIAFYEKAFGAQERYRMPGPDGRKVMHAELQLGDSIFFIVDEFPEMGPMRGPKTLGTTSVTMHLYVADCDASYHRAVEAGATPKMPPMDMFWGDRYAMVEDPFGHVWSIATHLEDLTPEQMRERAVRAFCPEA